MNARQATIDHPRAEPTRSLDWVEALRRREEAEIPELRGARLIGSDLSGLDLSGRDLRDADLSNALLTDTNFFGADLRGAILFHAEAEGAEFSGANLADANLDGLRSPESGFGRAKLQRATLRGAHLNGATFSDVEAEGADFSGAVLHEARFCNADIRKAEFVRADMAAADLSDARVDEARFRNASMREAIFNHVSGFETADWIGADIRDADCRHGNILRRFVGDQNYLEEFSQRFPWVYRLWSVTCDCGRSLVRWGLWTLGIVFVFAFAYTLVDIDYGDHETWFSPVYYSVVTLTTLGYGDVLPASVPAQVLAVSESIVGYIMLGGLLSILTQKMGRRSE